MMLCCVPCSSGGGGRAVRADAPMDPRPKSKSSGAKEVRAASISLLAGSSGFGHGEFGFAVGSVDMEGVAFPPMSARAEPSHLPPAARRHSNQVRLRATHDHGTLSSRRLSTTVGVVSVLVFLIAAGVVVPSAVEGRGTSGTPLHL